MPSSLPDEQPDSEDPQSTDAFLARMRDGIRGVLSRLGEALPRAGYPTLTALICSSACAPVVAAALGAGATLAAAIGTLGAIGGNALSELISNRLDRIRSTNANASVDEYTAALTETFAEVLRSDSPELAEIRQGIAALLQRTDAFEIVMREAVAEGNQELLAALRPEFEALAASSEENRLLLIGMHDLLLGLCRDQAQSLGVQETVREVTEESLGLLVQMFQLVQFLAAGMTAGVDPRQARWEGSPYRGLQPFTAREAPIFFGRTVTLAELVTKAKSCVTAGMMIVAGPSGVGKSSLLRAGLVPAIESGLLRDDPGQGPWRSILVDKPGGEPVRALAEELAKHGGPDSGTTRRSLEAHPEEAADRIEERRTGADGERPERLMLVIDQFEDLFTIAEPQQCDRFMQILEVISQSPRAFVVLGVRSDFVDRCMAVPALREVVQDRLFRVGPMTREQMRQAATLPATTAGVHVDDRIVEELLEELCGAEDAPKAAGAALPLLSQTMLLLWEHGRESRRLTHGEYMAIGGVRNAVKTAAEWVYESLDTEGRAAAERLFRRLTGAERGERLVRLTLSRNALTTHDRRVAEAFLKERLLVADESTIAIAHDVLLDEWDRLREWLEPDLTSRALFTQLESDAVEWDQNGRDTSFLYRGARLAELETSGIQVWRDRADRGLQSSDLALEFIDQSRDRNRRGLRVRRVLTGALAGLTALALILAGLSYMQSRDLTEQRNRAISQQLAAESAALLGSDGQLAQLLAAAAWKLSETDEAFTALAQAVGDQSVGHVSGVGAVGTMAFSPNGNLLATRAFNGALALWSTDTWTFEELVAGDAFQSDPNELEFSPDGSRLAAAMDEGAVLWNIDTLELETIIAPGNVEHVAFNPDGSTLAYAQNDQIRLWDMRTGAETGSIPTTAHSLAFSADGMTLFAGGYDADYNSLLQQWDLASLELLVEYPIDGYSPGSIQVNAADPTRLVVCEFEGCSALNDHGSLELLVDPQAGNPMAISDDGAVIAGQGSAGEIVIWDATTGERVHQIWTEDYISITSMAFRPGTLILAAGSSSGVQLWDLDRAPLPSTVLVSSDDGYSVNYATISGDGRRAMVYGSYDDTAIIELPATVDGEPTVTTKDRNLWDGRLSPDGTVSAGFLDESLEVATIETGEPVAAMEGDDLRFFGLEFSPDGDLLAIGVSVTEHGDEEGNGESNEVWLWDYEEDEVRARITDMGSKVSMNFSSDGALLATGDYTGQVSIWNTDDGSLDARFDDVGVPTYLKFSSDDSRLGFMTPTGLSLLNLDSGDQEQLDTGPLTGDFDFSPDGRYITYPTETGIRFWSLERDQLVAELSVGRYGASYGIFVPHSGQIVVGDGYGVHLVDVEFLNDPYVAVCEQAGRDLTDEEWNTYLPDFEFRSFEICPRASEANR